MNLESLFYIKTNRTFTMLRKYAWIFTLIVAIGGLWYPKLGLLVIPVIIGLSMTAFFKGRFWCGNICAHGSLFDSLLFPISKNRKIPDILKSKILRTIVFLFFTFSLSRKLINVIIIYGEENFLDKLGYIFVFSYLVVTVLGGLLSILITPRAWCQFCPMGSLQKLMYKLGKKLNFVDKSDKKVSVFPLEACHECGKCARVCPMQLFPYLDFAENGQLNNEACIRCGTCVENCPADILELENEKKAVNLVEKLKPSYTKNKITGRIKDIADLNKKVKEITFELINPELIDIEAGQFILIKVSDEFNMYRAYSISSINDNGKIIKVSIMKVNAGYGTSIIFNNFKKNDIVSLKGPMGEELIVDKSEENLLLVAGGIGITPFIPIVEDLINSKNDVKNIKLIYGVNKESDFLYRNKFKKFSDQSDIFDFIPVVAFDDEWDGERGFVTDIMGKMDLKKYTIYMCGPGAMEEAARKLLDSKNISEEKVFVEST